jgi:membrane-bound lytic murein transglycosylase MltF
LALFEFHDIRMGVSITFHWTFKNMKKKISKNKLQKKTSNVDSWLKKETMHSRAALENASRHFDDKDVLTVNTLEAIYGQESSFGKNRRQRGMSGAAGDFQLERNTAKRMGLTISEKNDERFDVDNASAASAKYLKIQDKAFSKKTILSGKISTSPIKDSTERKKFVIAAFNAGEGRIAMAQKLAQEDGSEPAIWDDVKKYLESAGATPDKSKEIQEYVDKVLEYEAEFSKKSKADKMAKSGKPRKIRKLPAGGHWITIDGKHIFIEDK